MKDKVRVPGQRLISSVPPKAGKLFCFLFCFLFAGAAICHGQFSGGMLDPSIDKPGEPFSYFWHPTDVIGSLFAPVASEVTPEGYIYNGFGDLIFLTGNPPKPVNQRVKVLEKGYLPIVRYDYREGGFQYAFTAFAVDLGGQLKGLPVNFVRVQVSNVGKEARTTFFGSAFRVQPPITTVGEPPDYRFRQRFDLIPSDFTAGQMQFNPKWKYQLTKEALVRDASIIYSFASNPKPFKVSMAEQDSGFRLYRFLSGEIEGDLYPSLDLAPDTPVGIVMYKLTLDPGETKSLFFKCPVAPIRAWSPAAGLFETATFNAFYPKVVADWTELVGKQSRFSIPEEKVEQFLLANTVYSILAIDKVGDDYIPNVNKFQYHTFYPTDTSLMAISLDDMGQQETAGRVLRYALKKQDENGSLIIEKDLWESFGHVLWAWNRHFSLTHDSAFLAQVYPAVRKAMQWEIELSSNDPLGITPVATISDDAQLSGCHQTGQSIWTLIGIEAATQMAEAGGQKADAAGYEAEFRRFHAAFEKALEVQTAKTGGYVPPALDRTLKGNDWDNLHLLYPEPLFAPSDPRVAATIEKVRAAYREGLLAYIWPVATGFRNGGYEFNESPGLHYWHSPDIAENQMVRGQPGDQEAVVRDMYALLLHTTSTHAGQEFGTQPWGTRDLLVWNILPDGSTSAVTVELIRNMLVREYKDELHLFSVLSPDWAKTGKVVGILGAPTIFGPVTANLRFEEHGFSVELSNAFWKAPSSTVIHIPWFFEATGVIVDGKNVAVKDDAIVVSPAAKSIKVSGRYRDPLSQLSFAKTVEDYKAEYARRYAHFLRTGDLLP